MKKNKLLFVLLFLGMSSLLQVQAQGVGKTLYYPHFALGGGYDFRWDFTNFNPQKGKGTPECYLPSGDPYALPTDRGYAPFEFEINGNTTINATPGSEMVVGWCKVTFNVRATGPLVFTDSTGQPVPVEPSPLLPAVTVQVHLDRSKGVRTGVALINPNAVQNLYYMNLFDHDRKQIAQKVVTLPSMGQIARFADESDLFQSELASYQVFHGTMEVIGAPNEFAAMAIGSTTESGPFKFYTQPPSPGRYSAPAVQTQAILFLPLDVDISGPDETAIAAVSNLAEISLRSVCIELLRAGEPCLSSKQDFVRDAEGRVKVDVIRGRSDASVYATPDAPGLFLGLSREFVSARYKEVYEAKGIQRMWVVHRGITLPQGYYLASITYSPGPPVNVWLSYFPGPSSAFWEDLDLSNILAARPKTAADCARWTDALWVHALAGRMLSRSAGMTTWAKQPTLQDIYPGQFESLMAFSTTKALGWLKTTVLPTLLASNACGLMQNTALSAEEVRIIAH